MSEAREKIAAHYAPTVDAYRRYWAPVLKDFARPLLDALEAPERDGPAADHPPAGGERRGPRRGLDLGCGIGTLEPEIHRLVGPGGHVVAGDITREMLAEVRKSAPEADPVLLDGTRLPFRDHAFDTILCAFVLHHVREQHRLLAEVCRVLNPTRGRFGLALWNGEDPANPAFDLFEDLLVKFGAPDADPNPLPRWDDETPDAVALAHLLESVGFARVRTWSGTPRYQWTAESFLGYRLGQGGSRRRFGRLSASKQARFREEAARRIAELSAEDLAWHHQVLYGVASVRAA